MPDMLDRSEGEGEKEREITKFLRFFEPGRFFPNCDRLLIRSVQAMWNGSKCLPFPRGPRKPLPEATEAAPRSSNQVDAASIIASSHSDSRSLPLASLLLPTLSTKLTQTLFLNMGPAFVSTIPLPTSSFVSTRSYSCSPSEASNQHGFRARTPRPCVMVQKVSSKPSMTDELSLFESFFSCMPGAWNSQRTYHYMDPGETQRREESQTTFDVDRLDALQLSSLLLSHGAVNGDVSKAQGFRVSFLTRMASQEALVRAGTNLAFVPERVGDGRVEGAYYRDMGYEESGPVKAMFVFNGGTRELQMTTWYSKVVSVDEIRLVNEGVRIRRIINFRRPRSKEMGLNDPVLIGYGVEVKGEDERLVQ